MRLIAALTLLLPVPALAAPTTVVPLTSGWQVRIDPVETAAAKAHPRAARWLPAHVPGTVQQELIAAGIVPDPFVGRNEAAIQWVGRTAWQYRLSLNVTPAMLARGHVDLVFDGLDTFAKVSVNGQALLTADNAHRRWRADAKALLRAGANEILIAFAAPIATLQPMVLAEKNPLPGEYDSFFGDEPKGKQTSPYIRKPKYHYGWDWGPRIIAIGPWRGARIKAWDDARLDDVAIVQEAVSPAEARLTIRARVIAARDGAREIATDVTGPDGRSQHIVRRATLVTGENIVTLPLTIDRPAIWQPVGYGAHPMYAVRTTLDGGEPTVRRTGLRAVELISDGGSFGLKINGIPIFMKGANLIPFDMFPARVTAAQQRRLLADAVAANMNMVRVWGGGYYLDDAFYDAADELGLLVWQDFMFGGSVTPPGAEFRRNVAIEAAEQVARLQAHPSLVLWAGNNEVQGGWENWSDRKAFKREVGADEQERIGTHMAVLFDRVLREAVTRNDADVPYWPGSPSTDYETPIDTDKDGDRHFWDVWSGSKPIERYTDSCPRFASEYGFQAMPDLATIRQFAGPGPLNPDSPVMKAHQKFLAGEGDARLDFYLKERLRPAKDFADFVYLSQVNQAQAIGLAARHHRACRPVTLGSLYWQLNDTWPAISWSSIDYDGRWKLLHHEARRFFAPQTIVAEHRDGATRVSLISDATTPIAATWRLSVRDMAGATLSTREEATTLDPLSAREVARIDDAALFGAAPADASYAVAELLIDGKSAARTIVERVLPKDMAYPDPALAASWNGRQVTITARALARAVMLDFGAVSAQPSDDGFDLLPGESLTVDVASDASPAALAKALTIRSLNR